MLHAIITFYGQIDERRDELIRTAEDLFDGTRKRQVSDWWLNYIGEEVREFLHSRDFDFDAIPVRYLDVPPSDLNVIKKNLNIVTRLITGEGEEMEKGSGSELESLLDQIVDRVYAEIDKYLVDMKIAIDFKWEDINIEVVPTDIQKDTLKRDVEYLLKMKEMDEEIRDRRKRNEMEGQKAMMSDVVPVSGLIMARFHILECELRSILMRWDKSMKGPPLPLPHHKNQDFVTPPDSERDESIPFEYRFFDSYTDSSEEQFQQFVMETSSAFLSPFCKKLLIDSKRQR